MYAVGGLVGAGALAAAGVAVAQSGDDGTIHACVSNLTGSVRIVDAGANCRAFEHKEEWSKAGPQGPAGPPGSATPEPQVIGVLVIDGIDGGSAITPGGIDAVRFSDVITAELPTGGGGGGGGAGKVAFDDLEVGVVQDKAHPVLHETTASGKHIQEVTFTLCSDLDACDDTRYLTYKLEDVVITGLSTSGVDTQPLEEITFNYSKIEWESRTQKADGTFEIVKAGWDVAGNKPL